MSSAHETDAVIVIFGAAVRPDGRPSDILRQRVEAAAAFGARSAAPLYLPTGAKGRHGGSEASVMARLLRDLGVPPERIMLEETGTDTLSSVRAVARMIRDRGLDAPAYVATSGYHQPRCRLLLRIAGITTFACTAPPASENHWHRWFWRLREVPAIPYDGALMLGLRLLRHI
jgi:vancomycin permeability regulator SanA